MPRPLYSLHKLSDVDGRAYRELNGNVQGDPVIEVEHLTKRYGNVVAVDDISFQVTRAKSSDFSGRTAQARRRRCAC